MKLCKDGRIWGQNNLYSINRLGSYKVKEDVEVKVKKGFNPNSKGKPFKKGNIPWNKGSKGNIPWNKGLNKNRKYNYTFSDEFKDLIRKRDNNKCSLCGITKDESFRNLDVHHVDCNPLNDNPMNLITLCCGCHKRIHSKNKKHWEEVFTLMLEKHEREAASWQQL